MARSLPQGPLKRSPPVVRRKDCTKLAALAPAAVDVAPAADVVALWRRETSDAALRFLDQLLPASP